MSDQSYSEIPARPTQIYSPFSFESKEIEPLFIEPNYCEKENLNSLGLYEPQSPNEKNNPYERPNRPRRGSVWTLSSLKPSYSLSDIPRKYQLTPYRSSRSLPLLESTSPLRGFQLSHSQKKYVPPLLLLGPVVIVLLCTAGMASLMLMWVYIHKLPLLSSGVIYLREGEENELGRQYSDATMGDDKRLYFNEMSSHPTTLSLSSVVVFLIGWSLYPMMGLIAYGLAADWLQIQEDTLQSQDTSLLPTSLEYALLSRVCSSNEISSIFDTAKHWIHNKQYGRPFPSMLKKAVIWLFVLLTLQMSIAWLDFTLHETTRTISVINLDQESKTMSFSMSLNQTLCPPDREINYSPCLYTPTSNQQDSPQHGTFAIENPIIVSKGWLTANSESDLVSVKTLATFSGDEGRGEMTFYAHPKLVPQYYVDVFSSLGSDTRCEVITSQCDKRDSYFDCSNVGLPDIKSNTLINSLTATIKGNPFQVSGLYASPNSTTVDESGFQSFLDRSDNAMAYSVFVCNVTILNLSISYFNDSFTIEQSSIADFSIARDLSGPLLADLLTNNTFDAISRVAGQVDKKVFAHLLSQSLDFNILAFSSGLIEQHLTTVRTWQSILAQQYDTSILFIYISLLYTYALVALVLFFSAWATSSRCIVYQDDQGVQREIPMVVLTQRLLMDPSSHFISTFLSVKKRKIEDVYINQSGDTSEEQIEALSPPIGAQRRLKKMAAGEEHLYVGLDDNSNDFGVWPMSSRGSKCFKHHTEG